MDPAPKLTPKLTLNNGVLMDQAGYGTYKVPSQDAAPLVSSALSLGYRHIDTAALYGNEEGVGDAVRNFTDDRPCGPRGPLRHLEGMEHGPWL